MHASLALVTKTSGGSMRLAVTKGNKRIVGPRSGVNGWQNVNPSGGATHHRTQEAAERQATKELRSTGGGERIVQGRDGRIRAKDTVPPAHDPRATKG
jgi:hypothetical protein